MKTHTVKIKLQALSEICLSPEVKSKQRELLLSQIQGQLAQEYTPIQRVKKNAIFSWQVFRYLMPTFVFRPVGTMVVALLLVVGGSAASVSAAKSLPGDILYSVKIATERAQLTFTRSEQTRAQLQIEFAQRRIEELQQITADPERQDKQIEKTMTRAKKNFEDAQQALALLSENNIDRDEMATIAKIIEEKSGRLNETVEGLQKDMKENVGVTELLEQIDQTNVAALTTLADTQDAESTDGLTTIIQRRIELLNKKIEALEALMKPSEDLAISEIQETPLSDEPVEERDVFEPVWLSVEEVKVLLKNALGSLDDDKSEEALALLAKASQIILETQKQADSIKSEILKKNNLNN